MGTKKIDRPRNEPNSPQVRRQVTTRQGRRVLKQRYLLKQELGKGGMGQTFLAQDTNFGDMCVVKIVKGDYQLIQREARQLCYLKHEGIPAYRDFIVESSARRKDEAFLVQEYIRGQTLKQLLEERGGKIPLRESLSIMRQLLEILHYLHTRKDSETQESSPVLHLDIKPENVILRDSDKQLFLIDFGLSTQAKLSLVTSQGVTPSIQGYSPGYSPHEQMQGQVVPASDLYALGMTVLVLLTGRDVREVRLFLDQNLLFHPSGGNLKLPSPLAKLLQRMTTLRVEERISSAEQALAAIKRFQRASSWIRKLLWILLLLGGGLFSYFQWFS